jgi:hypothetical protein
MGVGVGALATSTPAAAAIIRGKPDLTVSFAGATPNPATPVGLVTYTVYVSNSSVEQCNQAWPEPICTIQGGPASGVSVVFTLPAGASFQGGSGDHGFWCPPNVSTGPMTCTGGTLAIDDAATLSIRTGAPLTPGPFLLSALVDPHNTIIERSETNNSASVSVTVNPW